MKKNKALIIFSCIVLLASAANAQKNSWYVGGQLGLNSQKNSGTVPYETKITTWNVAPEVGTFLQNNLQLGFALNLSGSSVTNNNPKETSTKFSPVVYLRRFFKVGDKFSTFVGVVGTVTTGNATSNNTKYDLSGGGINLSLGAAYALSKRFTAVGQYGLFGYTSETSKSGGYKTTVSNFGLNVNSLGPVFNIGLYWTFKE